MAEVCQLSPNYPLVLFLSNFANLNYLFTLKGYSESVSDLFWHFIVKFFL